MTSRRTFIFGSAAVTVLPTACKPKHSADDIRVAVIGVHGKGAHHVEDLLGLRGVRIAAVCDVDGKVLAASIADIKKAGTTATPYTDYRKLCEDKDIDAVIIATPNHLHTLIALTAIAAGKHVYVEKPVSHNLLESRALVTAAAARPQLIITHGMQRRSDLGWAEAVAWANEGHLGKITLSRGLNYKSRESIGKTEGPQKVAKYVDYNLWCGPREVEPMRRYRLHYDWHWQWKYGNGDIGNQGPHQLDVARWALQQMALPLRTMSLGSRWGYIDDGETPNNQLAFFGFEKGPPLLFDNRGLPAHDMDWKTEPAFKNTGIRIGNIIHCEGGIIAESKAFDAKGNMVKKFPLRDGGAHTENWLEAIRQGKLVSDNQSILQGHLSAALVHLANISFRLGKKLGSNEVRERLQGDKEGLATLEDFEANLRANKIDMSVETATVGPWLSFDPVKEVFTGEFAAEANAMLTETYREEFKLPVIV